MSKKCGTCAHFLQAKFGRWGTCEVPLPWWVREEEPEQPILTPDTDASGCDAYVSWEEVTEGIESAPAK